MGDNKPLTKDVLNQRRHSIRICVVVEHRDPNDYSNQPEYKHDLTMECGQGDKQNPFNEVCDRLRNEVLPELDELADRRSDVILAANAEQVIEDTANILP